MAQALLQAGQCSPQWLLALQMAQLITESMKVTWDPVRLSWRMNREPRSAVYSCIRWRYGFRTGGGRGGKGG